MPRPQTIDSIIESTVSNVMSKMVPAIRQQVAAMVAGELEKGREGREARSRRQGRRRAPARSSRPRGEELTRWVADRRARRVPNFVIEMTGGLDTKKKIVARYGENAAFEKGKPGPKPVR